MALVKGTNSYATVEEADAYFADRLDVAAWSAADLSQKAKALVTATRMLDELNWLGVAISDSQTLAFPRQGFYFEPRLGMEVELDETVPSRILYGLFELAYHLLNNDGLLDNTGAVKDLSIGNIRLSTIYNAPKIPSSVKRFIKPLQLNQGSSFWWRAN